MTTLEHSPHSSDLAVVDFYLLPQLKSALKGRRFYDTTAIFRNATAELKRLNMVCRKSQTPLQSLAEVQLHKGPISEGNAS